MANDLNPDSFEYLQTNSKLNKVNSFIQCFNLDACDFIQKEIKNDLLSKWNNNEYEKSQIHITMNLPAMAIEFLPYFKGLFVKSDFENLQNINYPILHLYCFIKGNNNTEIKARDLVEEKIDYKIDTLIKEIHFVRNVSQNKDMYCVSFNLNQELLTYNDRDEPIRKKKCLEKIFGNDKMRHM